MITIAPETSLEIGKDALVAIFTGPEFAKCLEIEHARQPVKIGIRYPFVAYPDEVKTLDGYPALELVSGPTEHGDDAAYEHEISFQWTVNGDNEITMAREVMRLVAATRIFFEKTHGLLLPYVGGRFRAERSDTGPTSEGRTETFVKSASIRVMWNVHGF